MFWLNFFFSHQSNNNKFNVKCLPLVLWHTKTVQCTCILTTRVHWRYSTIQMRIFFGVRCWIVCMHWSLYLSFPSSASLLFYIFRIDSNIHAAFVLTNWELNTPFGSILYWLALFTSFVRTLCNCWSSFVIAVVVVGVGVESIHFVTHSYSVFV